MVHPVRMLAAPGGVGEKSTRETAESERCKMATHKESDITYARDNC